MAARGPPWLLALAAVSTSLGCCLAAALLNATAAASAARRRFVELPPGVSIPEGQLSQYDNGSVTFNWWRLHRCISRLDHCPPDFLACQLPESSSQLPAGDLVHLWHHFMLLGWAFFTCHQVAGMRRLFRLEAGGPAAESAATAAGVVSTSDSSSSSRSSRPPATMLAKVQRTDPPSSSSKLA